jgi:hypothetical protein
VYSTSIPIRSVPVAQTRQPPQKKRKGKKNMNNKKEKKYPSPELQLGRGPDRHSFSIHHQFSPPIILPLIPPSLD